MFAYCGNNPINFEDAFGTAYRPVGAGFQIEVTIGSYSIGFEVICYWDVEECDNGGVTIAVYAYEGISVYMSNPLLAGIVATIQDNADLLVGGTESEILAVAAMLTGSFDISVSGVLVMGNEEFTTTESYEKTFTSVGVGWGRFKSSYAYSDYCRAISVGASIVNSSLLPTWNASTTYYYQVFEWSTKQTGSITAGGGRAAWVATLK